MNTQTTSQDHAGDTFATPPATLVSPKYAELDKLLHEMNVDYSATFVPWSLSRKSGEKHPSLNWKLTLSKGRQSMTIDYTQGSGHLPPINNEPRGTVNHYAAVLSACEAGRTRTQRVAPPSLRDVMHCMVSDASVLDSGAFEDWASEYGYDSDSRAAEKIFRLCIEQALQLRAMIGETAINALREAYQDY